MKLMVILGLFLIGLVLVGVFIVPSIIPHKKVTLASRFDSINAFANEYGGAVIVTYNQTTGQIIKFRRQDYRVMPKTGALVVTLSEAKQVGLDNLPKNVVIVSDDITPSQAISGKYKLGRINF